MKTQRSVPLWRDVRFWWVVGQVLVVLLTAIAIAIFWSNLSRNLQQLGIQFGFGFLNSQAAFDIGETPISYRPSDNYARALQVGLANSLRVTVFGIVLATVVGVTAGIARLSDNWLVRQLALVYVETLRNTPLLLQLFFWYFAVFLGFPRLPAHIQLPGPIYLTQQTVALPWFHVTRDTDVWLLLLSANLLLVWAWHWWGSRAAAPTVPLLLKLLGTLAVTVAIALIIFETEILGWDAPRIVADSIEGGLQLSPEFAALLVGLSLYTATFIAEIVRGGVQSVSQGQWEAARALGLRPSYILRLVIFPQALRSIVPSLGNQYLNLAKNSSLAIAIGYSDLYAVASTTYNQTGRAVEVMVLISVTYLSISLVISGLINRYNRTVQLVER
ncbi:amino acid ABC transporter permease [Trichocoleus sp. FACHB-262]|uniref:amino acid ABC transporter permease n=1 Tax=Trichocoleus sp. FACHB-262 TaxID=2692869 RepID=UPI001682937F|nr:ABC transporter permease subunit [Trichocoleus sp. FACHB-262]MBD2123765.1 ABC transporter permease subunit [Trichocoleus sp. FACHB-262]